MYSGSWDRLHSESVKRNLGVEDRGDRVAIVGNNVGEDLRHFEKNLQLAYMQT